jgi:hypothetical protein
VGLGVSVGDLGHREGPAPRFYRLRRLRRAAWSLIDPVEVRDLDLYLYESSNRLLDAVNRTLAAAGLPAHDEPSTHGRAPVSFDLPSDGLANLERRLGEPLVDVYLPRDIEDVLQGEGIRVASTTRLKSACERAASDLGPLPNPEDDPSDFDAENEERFVCAALLAAAEASLGNGAAVVIG